MQWAQCLHFVTLFLLHQSMSLPQFFKKPEEKPDKIPHKIHVKINHNKQKKHQETDN